MATVEMDPMLGTVTGKFGNGIFKKWKNKTVLHSIPFKGTKRKSSPAQEHHRELFGTVVKEAKKVYHNKKKKAEYAVKCPAGMSVFNFIVAEVMKESAGCQVLDAE
jgi:hypothetical protein